MKRMIRIRRDRNRGQSMVELAVAMPLLLFFMLGTLDVGRVFFDYIQLRQAVVEGATYGTRHPTDAGGINTTVTEHNIPADTTVSSAVSGDCSNPLGGGEITVSAHHVFTPMFFSTLSVIAPGVDWNIQVNASSTMRCMT